jgi:hypothetical protein
MDDYFYPYKVAGAVFNDVYYRANMKQEEDIEGWMKSDYIHYIMPQIYWARDNQAAPFKPVFDDWVKKAVKYPNVRVYVVFGLHKPKVTGKELIEEAKICLPHMDKNGPIAGCGIWEECVRVAKAIDAEDALIAEERQIERKERKQVLELKKQMLQKAKSRE